MGIRTNSIRMGILLIASIMFGASAVCAEDLRMEGEIDFLLDSVVSSNCVFIRNGKKYAASAARDHLQMKRRRGKRFFDSADEFIERIASKSSWSGDNYLIQCGDAAQQTAETWFTALLMQYRNEPKNNIIQRFIEKLCFSNCDVENTMDGFSTELLDRLPDGNETGACLDN